MNTQHSFTVPSGCSPTWLFAALAPPQHWRPLLSPQLSHGPIPPLPLEPILQPQQLLSAPSGCCLLPGSSFFISPHFLFPGTSAFPHPFRLSSASWYLSKWLVWQALTQHTKPFCFSILAESLVSSFFWMAPVPSGSSISWSLLLF